MRALVLTVLAGCYVGQPPAAPLAPTPQLEEPPPRDAALVAAGNPGTMFVAGCNTGCADCWLGTYKTYVIGTLARTGARVFPAEPLAPGYACSTEVPVGERVILRAHSPEEGLVIDRWQTFGAGDYCPCAGTNVSECRVDVTPEIAASYQRVYCGASWKPGRHAAIAR